MKEKLLQSRTTTTSHDNRNSWIDLTIFLKLEPQDNFWSNIAVAALFVEMLKELRNRILCTTLVWSLFCLILLYVGLHFSMSSFRKLFFRLSVLSLNEDIKICVIMYVILNLFSTYVKTHLLVNNKLFKNVLYIVLLCKNLVSEMFWFFQKKRIYKEKWNSHKMKSVKKLGKSHKTV